MKDEIAKNSNRPDWNERDKFWAETARTVCLAILGSLAALWLLKPSENRMDFAGEVLSTKLKIRADAVEEFSQASYFYTVAAYGACKYRNSETMDKFQGEANERFVLARDRLLRSFDNADLTSQMIQIVGLATKLHDMCKYPQPPDPKWEETREELKEEDSHLAASAWQSLELSGPSSTWWRALFR